MTKQVQFRKGTTAEHFNFTGALAEITVDTDKNVAVVHDGVTPGGFELSKSRWTYVAGDTTTGTNQKYTIDSTYSPSGLNVTLPTPRAVGDWVWIEDFGNFMSINPVNIISDKSFENGHLVRESSPFIMDVSGASVTFIWNGSLWKVFNNRGS
mgnify:CR=1 FL=1|tara:strand:- start:1241 stop:1699 length:459 start_codon:yes stop_codon:yes gene_type:complete